MSVLLVEDSPADAGLVTAALGEVPGRFDVEWVNALHLAVLALVNGQYDCLVVDLHLSDAEGLEIVEILREAAGDAALVVLTGREDDGSGLAAIQLGVDDFLLKSELSSRGLSRAVQYAVERAKLRNDLVRAEESARVLSAIVESTGDAVYVEDLQGIITTWNRGAEELYHYTAQEMVGQHVSRLHPHGDESAPILEAVAQGRTVWGLEVQRRTSTGRLVDVSLTVSPMYTDNGSVVGASVIARDVSDRRLLQTELEHQATHDALTGLANRSLLADRLAEALLEAEADGSHVSLLFLDLDQFKAINDAQGHLAGDRLLVEVARRLCLVVRPSDTVARIGGDEFVILCRVSDTEAAQRVALRVENELARPLDLGGGALHLTASIGIAVSPPLEPDAESLLRHADAAMYEAKARGRARSQVFDVSFAHRSRQRLALAGELREALRTDQLSVHYQPVVDIGGGGLLGLEALARWQHPERGWVPPDVFVPLAEDTGLVAELDQWVLSRACEDTSTLRSGGVLPTEATLAVNFSARTVGDADLAAMVGSVVAEHRLPSDALVIEVTETALMNDPGLACRSLQALRERGLGVALDDFGTGYSSLSFLREMPVTHLKIDRSFVEHIDQRPGDQAITAAMIDLARGLDIHTVAEGIETAAQLGYLRQLGCDAGQGYLWSKAVPLQELAGALSQPLVGPAAIPRPRRASGTWMAALRRTARS
jgi:diguanylate cyclase (GGDEF)-like protein/PAS domain S-box-containing protein